MIRELLSRLLSWDLGRELEKERRMLVEPRMTTQREAELADVIHALRTEVARLQAALAARGCPRPRVDVIRLQKLATTMKADMDSGMIGLNKGAVYSIVEIIETALGAPLMQFTSEQAANVADKEYPGTPSMRHAFNHGVKWAQEQFTAASAARPYQSHPGRNDGKER